MPEVISTNTYRLRQAQISAVNSIGCGRLMQIQDAEKPAGKAERAEAILFQKHSLCSSRSVTQFLEGRATAQQLVAETIDEL